MTYKVIEPPAPPPAAFSAPAAAPRRVSLVNCIGRRLLDTEKFEFVTGSQGEVQVRRPRPLHTSTTPHHFQGPHRNSLVYLKCLPALSSCALTAELCKKSASTRLQLVLWQHSHTLQAHSSLQPAATCPPSRLCIPSTASMVHLPVFLSDISHKPNKAPINTSSGVLLTSRLHSFSNSRMTLFCQQPQGIAEPHLELRAFRRSVHREGPKAGVKKLVYNIGEQWS